jgi:hypothetical protein
MRACRAVVRLLADHRAADRDFADERAAVFERRTQSHVVERRRINLAADRRTSDAARIALSKLPVMSVIALSGDCRGSGL